MHAKSQQLHTLLLKTRQYNNTDDKTRQHHIIQDMGLGLGYALGEYTGLYLGFGLAFRWFFLFGVILIKEWFSIRVRVGLGANSLVLAVPLVWAGFVLMQLVSDYSCYYQGVGWGKVPAYSSKLGMWLRMMVYGRVGFGMGLTLGLFLLTFVRTFF